ncbi:SWI/SNF complex subunit SWI3D-like [Durio zibethinus]|uniref:SWI/SNF complex subunit SWI3D-like n=1 Tax=Durio zibethinus TaxID=66656 RepID=A0A6P5Z2J5_DURZI|nr:SWI/SNF complex subunit SWI3D-like [Durio zibethinus]
MEEKRRDAGNSPAAPSSVEPEPASTRRRAGAQKRKANSLSGSSSSSTPSKRVSREKSNMISYSPINHYGPLTRARQGAPSGNLALGWVSELGGAKLGETSLVKESVKAEDLEELNKASEEWDALEAKIEAEFEAIRSRDSNAHVVPNHCGWFSWTKVHHLEEHMLPSFFNGKSPMHTPDVYMDIRNWIMKKFHANPSTQIELKDLSDLEVGDMDARQEVLEFLDYWGLINFHPFPPVDSAVLNADGDGMAKKDSLLEKLFHFEAIESRPPFVSSSNLSTPSVPSGFLPESAIADDLVRPEGPAVELPEYHCNSCSADCSRKRYHCQKQADFDLCADCFTNGKFGSGMSSSDFILMEPAEAPGLSGSKWTDQETLLLLEALELYKENWNEIAEHVATKTKAQCILHFVQMPIEDVFFNCDDNIDTNSKETSGPAAMSDETSVPKDVPEPTGCKTIQEDQAQTTPMETSKPEDEKEVRVSEETSKPETGTDVKGGPETSKPEETNEAKDGQDTNENCAIMALREAFEAVGYNLKSESTFSFADVGNPVMALAGFFARYVGPNIAAAAAQSTLKLLSGYSPSIQLAARNCFLLEDPPDDKKEPTGSESVVNDMGNWDAQNVENLEDKRLNKELSTPVLGQKRSSSNHGNQNPEVSLPEEKMTLASPNDLSIDKKEPGAFANNEEVEKANLNESSFIDQSKDHQPSVKRISDNMASQVPPSSVEEKGGKETSAEEPSQPPEAVKEVDMSDSVPLGKNEPCDAAASKPAGEQSEPSEALENVETVSSSPSGAKNEQQPVKSSSVGEPTQPTEASNDVETVFDSQPSGRSEPQQPVTLNSVNENTATTDEIKVGKNKNRDSTETKGDGRIDKVKRTAVTALTAAAVKAKILADQEENQIRQLTVSLIEKQSHKMEVKLAFFDEMEGVIMRVKEQLDRSKQRLCHERAQIIAARLGLPASSSRAMPPSNTANRIATNFANSVARPPMSMTALRPPMSRPMGPMAPNPSNPFVSATVAGSSNRPASRDSRSSVGTK